MKFAAAYEHAKWLRGMLLPYCTRIEIAGSIRRKKEECKDIEIVCTPTTFLEEVDVDMFTKTKVLTRVNGFVDTLRSAHFFRIEKGDPETGKYIQVTMEVRGIKADIFIATPENWGYIFLIRTGSANFSHQVARTWCKKGFSGKDGTLFDKHRYPVVIKEEIDLFNLLGLPYVEPENRNL